MITALAPMFDGRDRDGHTELLLFGMPVDPQVFLSAVLVYWFDQLYLNN